MCYCKEKNIFYSRLLNFLHMSLMLKCYATIAIVSSHVMW